METSNVFLAIAAAMWHRGEDGEVVARELAIALDWAVTEGTGIKGNDAEIGRLLAEIRKDA